MPQIGPLQLGLVGDLFLPVPPLQEVDVVPLLPVPEVGHRLLHLRHITQRSKR